MQHAANEVEEFLDRISWGPENQRVIDSELGDGRNMDGGHTTHTEHESHPQRDIFADQDGVSSSSSRRMLLHHPDQASLLVHQPIPFNAASISFDAGEQRFRLQVQDIDWYNRILERYIDAGYSPRADYSMGNSDASILGIFRSLPPDLADVIKEGLDALHVMHTARTISCRPRSGPAPTGVWTGSFSAMEDVMWAENDQCGYLRFEWDPATERRRYSSSPRCTLSPAASLACARTCAGSLGRDAADEEPPHVVVIPQEPQAALTVHGPRPSTYSLTRPTTTAGTPW